jgi:hypothetical protein
MSICAGCHTYRLRQRTQGTTPPRPALKDKTVEDPQMVFLIPAAPKGAASTVSRKPATRAQIYEAAAMAAFVVLMLLFVVKLVPALVG